MVAARNSETHPLMKGMANAKAYVAYAQARPGMYGLMFRTERLDMTRPSLHEAATASFEGLANAVGAGRNEKLTGEALEALSLDQAAAIARGMVAGARLHHAAARRAAEGHPAPAARGHRRRPTARCDAALDRRAAAGSAERKMETRPRSALSFHGESSTRSLETFKSAQAPGGEIKHLTSRRSRLRRRVRAQPGVRIPTSWTTCAWHRKRQKRKPQEAPGNEARTQTFCAKDRQEDRKESFR